MRIYLDNAATSWPKALGMAKEVAHYIEHECININRTDSKLSESSFDFLFSLREKLSEFYNYPHPECVIFKSGITEAINWIIKGLLKKDDHVLVTSLEHNAVMRPLVQMGISFTRIPCDDFGYCDTSVLSSLLQPDTKALIINAASNVFGTVQNIDALSAFAKEAGLLFIIDTAQASPYIKIDMQKLNAAAICFAGHKGFMGPQGTGGFIIRKDLALSLEPLIAGGTGSRSDSEDLPFILPDRFSSGTENLPGLKGLSYSVNYVISNYETLSKSLRDNTQYFYNGLLSIGCQFSGVIRIVGPTLEMDRTNVISVVSEKFDLASIADYLALNGVETRVGMHCSPAAHKALGTFPGGTLRFSPGPFTTKKEMDFALDCLTTYLKKKEISIIGGLK